MSRSTEVELHGQEADPIGQLVGRWLATKTNSVNTRRAYGRDIVGWLGWCADHDVAPLTAREEHAGMWAIGLANAKASPATIARKLSAVSGWYSWLARNGYADRNPVDGIDRPHVDPDATSTPGLTKDQAQALLEAADVATGPQGKRSAALVAMLLFTGVRVSEALAATMADLGVSRGLRTLTVTRKGGKRQSLVIPGPVSERLDAYLSARGDVEHRPAVPGDVSSGPSKSLFATATGRPMLPDDVRRMLAGLGAKAGFPDVLVARLGPHVMRHGFATLALDAGVPLRDVQDAMGHADPRTTRRYDRSRHNLDRSPGLALASFLAKADA
jgi:integrase/recombinase XerD